jgi:ABC-2 type transport system ATP-binding protein
MQPAISVRALTKCYGDVEALRGIDFEVATGEVFGLLGPNGAGKTTTVEILEGLRARTGGDVAVVGFDPSTNVKSIKDRIGVSLQATNLPDKITVREALHLFAAFYSRRGDIDALLRRLQLEDKKHSYYARLSGGQKQRLALALALVNDPELLFLDEPTSGLDPQVRLEIHSLIQELRDTRRTILLTTHYIEEAERLCDRVAIIDEGRIVAIGSPRDIQARAAGRSQIEIRIDPRLPPVDMPATLAEDAVVVSECRTSITASSASPSRCIVELVKWIDQQGAAIADIQLRRPTLEDAFIELTGKRLRE